VRASDNKWTANLDYCAGDNPIFQVMLLQVVLDLMARLPEETQGDELETILPGYEIRPINLDPCWNKLQALSRGEGLPSWATVGSLAPAKKKQRRTPSIAR
jgi:hypothetical protein